RRGLSRLFSIPNSSIVLILSAIASAVGWREIRTGGSPLKSGGMRLISSALAWRCPKPKSMATFTRVLLRNASSFNASPFRALQRPPAEGGETEVVLEQSSRAAGVVEGSRQDLGHDYLQVLNLLDVH